MQKAIIVGSASGIGKETARVLSKKGYKLGLADNRIELLKEFSKELTCNVLTKEIDVSRQAEARALLAELIEELDGVDVFIYCAGVKDKTRTWEGENYLHQVNAVGFAALANMMFNYYRGNNQKGQIVGISSMLAMHGFYRAVAYSASKAFMRSYMQGLRYKSAVKNLGITITEIRPGYVRTAMLEDEKGIFWDCSVESATTQIVDAIDKRKNLVYVSRRWGLVGFALKFLPDSVLHNLRIL